MQTGMNIKKAL